MTRQPARAEGLGSPRGWTRGRLFALLVCVGLGLVGGCTMVQPTTAVLGTEQNPVKLALPPGIESQKAIGAGERLVQLLERETGLRLKLSVPTSHAAAVEAMGTHNLDVAWVGPLAYVLAHERVGAEPLAVTVVDGSAATAGLLVVRADSGITRFDQLRGRRVAVADAGSTLGRHRARALVAAQGLDPSSIQIEETPLPAGNDDVLRVVAGRQAQAGLVVGPAAVSLADLARAASRTLTTEQVEQLRVIARSEPLPNDALVARRGVPPDLAARLRDGLLRLAAGQPGAAVLRELHGADGLSPIADADYASARALVQILGLDLDAEVAPRRTPTRP